MEYLLGVIQSAISNPNQDIQPVTLGFASARECVAKRCQEDLSNPKLKVILDRIDPSKYNTTGHQPIPDCSPNWDGDDCNNADSDNPDKSSATGISDGNDARPKCPKCSKTFSDKREVRRHNDAVHLGLRPFKCSTCFKSFSYRRHLRNHFNAVHLHLKPFKCDICDKSFARGAELRRHKAKPHPPKQENPISKNFPCEFCEKAFINLRKLKSHTKRVHGEKRSECDICKKTFRDQGHLNRHISAVHEKQRHHCQAEGCESSYSLSTSLQAHYRLNHPDLIKHQKTPTDYSETLENGETLFECKICTKRLKNINLVKQHLKTVHGPKTFLCEYCDYSTSYQNVFKRHIENNHDINKQVECEFCRKHFKSLFYKKMHVKRVHGPKTYLCIECGYATAEKYVLDKHVKQNHSV